MYLLVLRNVFIRKVLRKVKQYILKFNGLVKKIEYLRGLYRYPNKMLGRHFNLHPKNKRNTDVLVIAAHQDDDALGLGTVLCRHSLKGDNIKVVFVTNGTAGAGESWHLTHNQSRKKAELRYNEAIEALSHINVSKENVFCLGFPDGGTQRYLKEISMDITKLFHEFNPKQVYVHCIEGGHIDHDLTSFAVKSVCRKIGYANLFEWSEYNPSQPIGTPNIKFLPSTRNRREEIVIHITEQERNLKRKMLACHQSQDIEQHYMEGEAIRKADIFIAEEELKENCQLSNKRLFPIVKSFHKEKPSYQSLNI